MKRFNEVISILSISGASNEALNKVQHEVNNTIHYNLQNFMLPSKVEEVINSLSTTFIKMKGLRGLPQKVDERRNQLLEQGRTIVRTLKPYAMMEYSKEEYEEVYRLMFKRKVAQYIEDKPKLTVESATAILSESKKILKEYTEIVGDTTTCSKSFMKMIDELKTFITDSL